MNERYENERAKLDLALAMIAREARTNTIRSCTGLSDDRIRKLCNQYFTHRDGRIVRRRRGKSPQQLARYVKNAPHQLEATTLMHLMLTASLLTIRDDNAIGANWSTPDVAVGAAFCRVYDLYRAIHKEPLFGFEWAWSLMIALANGDTLAMATCDRCDADYLFDRFALDFHVCPACEIRTERRRRPGARQFANN